MVTSLLEISNAQTQQASTVPTSSCPCHRWAVYPQHRVARDLQDSNSISLPIPRIRLHQTWILISNIHMTIFRKCIQLRDSFLQLTNKSRTLLSRQGTVKSSRQPDQECRARTSSRTPSTSLTTGCSSMAKTRQPRTWQPTTRFATSNRPGKSAGRSIKARLLKSRRRL